MSCLWQEAGEREWTNHCNYIVCINPQIGCEFLHAFICNRRNRVCGVLGKVKFGTMKRRKRKRWKKKWRKPPTAIIIKDGLQSIFVDGLLGLSAMSSRRRREVIIHSHIQLPTIFFQEANSDLLATHSQRRSSQTRRASQLLTKVSTKPGGAPDSFCKSAYLAFVKVRKFRTLLRSLELSLFYMESANPQNWKTQSAKGDAVQPTHTTPEKQKRTNHVDDTSKTDKIWKRDMNFYKTRRCRCLHCKVGSWRFQVLCSKQVFEPETERTVFGATFFVGSGWLKACTFSFLHDSFILWHYRWIHVTCESIWEVYKRM